MRYLFLFLISFTFLTSQEKEAHKNFLTQDSLTGDWGGARTSMNEHGVNLGLLYTFGLHGNPVGGILPGLYYNSILNLSVDLDFEKMLKWSGASFHASGMWIFGTNGSAYFVGDKNGFNNIVNDPTVRLYHLWFQQNFFEETISFKIGSFGADDEFFCQEIASLFLNSSFGTPAVLSANMPTPIFAITALGARLRINFGKSLFFQTAVFDGNPDPDTLGDRTPGFVPGTSYNRNGVGFKLSASEGVFAIAEAGIKINPHEEGKKDQGPRGIYKAGFAYHSDTFSDIYDVASGASKIKSVTGNYALYFAGEQIAIPFEGMEDGGVGLFARGSYAPSDRNVVSLGFEGGILCRGPFGREMDKVGFGFAYYGFGLDYIRGVKTTGATLIPDYETALELTYQILLTPWFSIQPDIQYILRTGGTTALGDALVLGVRGSLNF